MSDLDVQMAGQRPAGEHVLVLTPGHQHIETQLVCLALERGEYMSVACHYLVGPYREGEVECGIEQTWSEITIDCLEQVPATDGQAPSVRLPVTARYRGTGEDSELWVRPLPSAAIVEEAMARVRVTKEFHDMTWTFGMPVPLRDRYLETVVRVALGLTS